MFSQDELRQIVEEAQSGLPQSVSSDPENALSPDQKKRLRGFLVAAIKGLFSAFTGINLPVSNAPAELRELAPELETYVSDGLAARHAARHPGLSGAESIVSFPGSAELIAILVKSALETAASTYGDAVVDLVLTQREQITKLIGDSVLDKAERLIEGLRGAQTAN